MRTSDLVGLLLAGTLLVSQTALGVASEATAIALPKADHAHVLPLPAIPSSPWWLDNDPSSGAPSGIFAAQLLAQLEIAPEIRTKIKVFPAGAAAIYGAVANGDVAMGLGQITEIRAQPSVDFLGPLPDAIQNYTSFAAGIISSAREPNASKAFISFLSSSSAVQLMKERGLEAF